MPFLFPSCILSKFYIKPQLVCRFYVRRKCCILSKFYIKPQQSREYFDTFQSCILSKFYIKPQPSVPFDSSLIVVSYRNSTSNHNCLAREVILSRLYLIEILHQTTTKTAATLLSPSCILSKFYIKPQPRSGDRYTQQGCILSKFYIKPQQCCGQVNQYQCCILSKFYIKPQQVIISIIALLVVSYRNSTSNHNTFEYVVNTPQLYLIEILHQTTTQVRMVILVNRCILSKFYIKPQQKRDHNSLEKGCILSKFYIKPQQSL